MVKYDIIIGIDPGKSGAMIVGLPNDIQIIKFKEKHPQLKGKFILIPEGKLMSKLNKITARGKCLAFVERVSMWNSDQKEGGKWFGIQKMMKQYEKLKTLLVLAGIDIVEVDSRSWQKMLGVKLKGIEKSERKKLYKKYAQEKFPHIKITMDIADALCIYNFGRLKCMVEPSWVQDRVQINTGGW